MENLLNLFNGSLKRYRMRRGYKRMDGRQNLKTIRLGGSPQRSWRLKPIPKFRFKLVLSPFKLWTKLKTAYVSKMLSLAGNVGQLNNGNALIGKRIPKARQLPIAYSNSEFDSRLVYEIYKTLVASRELATT